MNFINYKKVLLCIQIVTLLFSMNAYSADDKGQFAVRGVGLINCALFNHERATQDKIYLMTSAWVDGYVSGINQYSTNTYDLLSFESSELLMSILSEHCKKNPQDPVFGVVRKLFEKIKHDSLLSLSRKISIEKGERKVLLYVEFIKRVQQKLTKLKLYNDDINGIYSKSTEEAIKAFQLSIDFNPTGFPDQLTLWKLIRSEVTH